MDVYLGRKTRPEWAPNWDRPVRRVSHHKPCNKEQGGQPANPTGGISGHGLPGAFTIGAIASSSKCHGYRKDFLIGKDLSQSRRSWEATLLLSDGQSVELQEYQESIAGAAWTRRIPGRECTSPTSAQPQDAVVEPVKSVRWLTRIRNPTNFCGPC